MQADCGGIMKQRDMNDCTAREAKRVQALLDTLVQELKKTIGRTASEELTGTQATWVTYRDTHCRWQAKFFEGGSIQPTVYSECLIGLTWSRIDDLKFDLCEGWGMTGPCAASRRFDRPTDRTK
jgi:uncharacterized protein YecT (DUF1311 family)